MATVETLLADRGNQGGMTTTYLQLPTHVCFSAIVKHTNNC